MAQPIPLENFDLAKRVEELSQGRFKDTAALIRSAERRQIPLQAKTLYQALRRGGCSLILAGLLADVFSMTIDQFVGREPLPDPAPEDRTRDDIERQLLFFYRNVNEDRQIDIISLANLRYNQEHPEDRRAMPFVSKNVVAMPKPTKPAHRPARPATINRPKKEDGAKAK